MHLIEDLQNRDSIWVFGYGSILWKPDFEYSRREVGLIVGYNRRFWQGSITHRGTNNKMGRVATLVEDTEGQVWGEAFEISGEEAIANALGGLAKREITLGGYDIIHTTFYPRDGALNDVIHVYMYVATSQNDLFLGDGGFETMATQMATAHGFAGPNAEYVTRLADYVRKHIPEDEDEHLFTIDSRIRDILMFHQNDSVPHVHKPPPPKQLDSDEDDFIDTSSVTSDDEELFELGYDIDRLFI